MGQEFVELSIEVGSALDKALSLFVGEEARGRYPAGTDESTLKLAAWSAIDTFTGNTNDAVFARLWDHVWRFYHDRGGAAISHGLADLGWVLPLQPTGKGPIEVSAVPNLERALTYLVGAASLDKIDLSDRALGYSAVRCIMAEFQASVNLVVLERLWAHLWEKKTGKAVFADDLLDLAWVLALKP